MNRKTRRFQIGLSSLFIVMTGVACTFTFRDWIMDYYSYSNLSSDNMTRSFTPLGPVSILRSDAADYFRKRGEAANPWLLRALSHPQKCAAAHQLLKEINRNEFDAAAKSLKSTGTPFPQGSFNNSQNNDLQRFWKLALEAPNTQAE